MIPARLRWQQPLPLLVVAAVLAALLFGLTDSSLQRLVLLRGGVNGSGTYYYDAGETSVSAPQSSVQASPASVPADGSSTSSVTVTVRNDQGDLIAGSLLSLATNRPGNDTVTASSTTTDTQGQVIFNVSSTLTGTSIYTATGDGVTVTQTATVTFTAPPVSASLSTVTAAPSNVPADGVAASTVTVTVRDTASTPAAGKTVTLDSDRTGDTITSTQSVTDTSGIATFTIASAAPGTSTLTATTDGVTLGQTATVTFTDILTAAFTFTDTGIAPTIAGVSAGATITLTNNSSAPVDLALVRVGDSDFLTPPPINSAPLLENGPVESTLFSLLPGESETRRLVLTGAYSLGPIDAGQEDLALLIVVPPTGGTGNISGTVIDATSGNAPLAGAEVRLRVQAGGTIPSHEAAATQTDGQGTYTFSEVAPSSLLGADSYRVVAVASGKARQAYSGRTDAGDPVVVTAGQATSGVDFALDAGGTLSGTVRRADGSPLDDATISVTATAVDNSGVADPAVAPFTTLADVAGGTYALPHLVPGTYRLAAQSLAGRDYAPTWYPDQPVESAATLVAVGAGAVVSAVDPALPATDTLPPTVSAVSPASSGVLTEAVVSYTLAQPATTGEVRFEQSGSAPLVATLSGNDLTASAHTDVLLPISLVPDVSYTVTWDFANHGGASSVSSGAVTFVPPDRVSVGDSAVTTTPVNAAVDADGTQALTLLVTLRNADGLPLPGRAVEVASSRNVTAPLNQVSPPVDVISPSAAVTDGSGVAVVTVRSDVPGTATLTVSAHQSANDPNTLVMVSTLSASFQSLSLSRGADERTVVAGGTTSGDITLSTVAGFGGTSGRTVNLAVQVTTLSGVPVTEITASISPNAQPVLVAEGTAIQTITLTVPPSGTAGDFHVVVTAQPVDNPALVVEFPTPLLLHVSDYTVALALVTPDTELIPPEESLLASEITQGRQRQATLTVCGLNGFAGDVSLVVNTQPALLLGSLQVQTDGAFGLSASTTLSLSGTPAECAEATVTISAPTSAPLQTFALAASGSAFVDGATVDRDASPVTVTVVPPTVAIVALPVASGAEPFTPQGLTVQMGQTVRWKNTDTSSRRIVGAAGVFASGPIPAGGSYQQRFDTPGLVFYQDAADGNLRGVIRVVEVTDATVSGLLTGVDANDRLAGATVEVLDSSGTLVAITESGPDGTYQVIVLGIPDPATSYTLKVAVPGWPEVARDLSLTAGDVAVESFQLSAAPQAGAGAQHLVEVVVVNGPDGQGVVGVVREGTTVVAERTDGSETTVPISPEVGTNGLALPVEIHVGAGSWQLVVDEPGYVPAIEVLGQVSGSQDRTLTLVPRPAQLALRLARVPLGTSLLSCSSAVTGLNPPYITSPSGLLALDVVLTLDEGASATGAQFTLAYDPQVFTLVDAAGQPASTIFPCETFSQELANAVDASTGTVQFAAGVGVNGGVGASLGAGEHPLARLLVRAEVVDPGSLIEFVDDVLPFEPAVTGPDTEVNLLHDTIGATVRVRPGVPVAGVVRLRQGRDLTGTEIADSRTRLVRVRVFQPGVLPGDERELVATRDVVTDSSGRFEVIVAGLSVGPAYVVNVQAPRSVSRDQPFTVGQVVDFEALPVGDANGDDVVNILDFAVLVREFGQSGDTLRADFREDGTLNVLDYSLLVAGNFGEFGTLAGSGLLGPEPVFLQSQPPLLASN